MNKPLMKRVVLFSSLLLVFGSFFQNCSQPGSINLSGLEASRQISSIVTDPVTLIGPPSFKINKGESYTKVKNVDLDFIAAGAEEVQITNGEICDPQSLWISYSQKKSWTLNQDNALNTISVRFRKKGVPETICIKSSITHDNQLPVLSLTQMPPAFTNSPSLQIDFKTSDDILNLEKITCQQPNSVETPCEKSYVFNTFPVDGTYSVTIKATDLSGNESQPLTTSFVVDRIAPIITINGPQGATANTSLKYSLTVADSSGTKSVVCRLSPLEANFKDCSSLKIDYSDLKSGSYNFEVKATDLADNNSSKSQSIEIDLSVPTVNITKGPLTYINTKQTSFEFSGLNGTKPLQKFMCSFDGAAYANCTSPIVLTNLQDANHQFSVYGINELNVLSSAQTYKFTVDTLNPQIKVSNGPLANEIKKINTIALTLEANDSSGFKSIICYLNGQASDCITKSVNYTALKDGSYTFTARAIDLAGNYTDTAPLNWTIDTTPESQIMASFSQNPIKDGTTGILNINLISVTQARYECLTSFDKLSLSKGNITGTSASVNIAVNADIICNISGLNKKNEVITKSVAGELGCGNRLKSNGKCVDFKCTNVISLPYSNTITVPARTIDGVCYAMKIFDAIPVSNSGLSPTTDSEVISRNHGGITGTTRNSYIMNKALVNLKLLGPRVVKLSGGTDATTPILADNFVVIGLYLQIATPLVTHYAAYGSSDSTIPGTNHILFKNEPLPLTPFATGGTSSIAPLEIVKEADSDLNYLLDVRALDCGGVRQLSNMYLLFQ